MPVREHDGLCDAKVRIIPGLGAGDRHDIALFDRIPMPTIPDQDAGTGEFQIPIHHLTIGALYVDEEVGVRIGPVDLRHHPFQVELLGGVKLRRTRMVGQRGNPDISNEISNDISNPAAATNTPRFTRIANTSREEILSQPRTRRKGRHTPGISLCLPSRDCEGAVLYRRAIRYRPFLESCINKA